MQNNHERIEAIEKDVRTVKNKVLTFLIMIIVAIFGYGVWVGSIQQRVTHAESGLDILDVRIEQRLIRIENKIDNIISNNNF